MESNFVVIKEDQFNAIFGELKALQESLNNKSEQTGDRYIGSSTVIKQLGISQRTFQTWRDKKIFEYHMVDAKI